MGIVLFNETQLKIYDRFLEILDYMDRRYVDILEEIVNEEAEILSKNELSEVDELRLIGLRIMKELIVSELRSSSMYREESLLEDIEKRVEEAVVKT